MKTNPLNETIDSIYHEIEASRNALACARGAFENNGIESRDISDANTHLNNIVFLLGDIEERLTEIAGEFP